MIMALYSSFRNKQSTAQYTLPRYGGTTKVGSHSRPQPFANPFPCHVRARAHVAMNRAQFLELILEFPKCRFINKTKNRVSCVLTEHILVWEQREHILVRNTF